MHLHKYPKHYVLWFNIHIMGLPITRINLKYIFRTPQQDTYVCKGVTTKNYLQIHITIVMSPDGILFIETWGST
jgi:hypothetical protein